jgi:hypothetical protein
LGILIDMVLGASLIVCLAGLVAYEVRDRRRQRTLRNRPGHLPELSYRDPGGRRGPAPREIATRGTETVVER